MRNMNIISLNNVHFTLSIFKEIKNESTEWFSDMMIS